MKPEGWTVVTNGTKYRLWNNSTGAFWDEFNNNPLTPRMAIKEWDSLEEAMETARKNTWEPV